MTSFQPDQRPFVFYSPFGGIWSPTNLYGLDGTWRTNPAQRVAELRTLAGEVGGADRLYLSMVQGSLESPSDYPASNSGILDLTVLEYFTETFEAQPGEEWGIYSGRLMPHNGQQTSGTTAPSNRKASTDADAQFIAAALQLYGEADFVEVGLDASSDAPTFTDTTLPNRVTWARKIIAEALPIYDAGAGPGPGGRLWSIDQTLITQRAYLALDAAYITVFDPTNLWTIPYGCEVHAICYNENQARMESLRSRGFIVSAQLGCSSTVKSFINTTYFTRNRPRYGNIGDQ